MCSRMLNDVQWRFSSCVVVTGTRSAQTPRRRRRSTMRLPLRLSSLVRVGGCAHTALKKAHLFAKRNSVIGVVRVVIFDSRENISSSWRICTQRSSNIARVQKPLPFGITLSRRQFLYALSGSPVRLPLASQPLLLFSFFSDVSSCRRWASGGRSLATKHPSVRVIFLFHLLGLVVLVLIVVARRGDTLRVIFLIGQEISRGISLLSRERCVNVLACVRVFVDIENLIGYEEFVTCPTIGEQPLRKLRTHVADKKLQISKFDYRSKNTHENVYSISFYSQWKLNAGVFRNISMNSRGNEFVR